MFTAFVVIQVGINAALLILLARLLRERGSHARQALDREEQLAALAAELCAVGRALARQGTSGVGDPSPAAGTEGPPPGEGGPERPTAATEAPYQRRELAERVRGATALLEQGLTVETVAAETSLLPGEVQVLNNLRRASESARYAADPARPHTPARAHREPQRVRA